VLLLRAVHTLRTTNYCPMTRTDRLTIDVPGSSAVSAILVAPEESRALCVMAHGAGAGMDHPFMRAVASGLANCGIATLRYQFPYMQAGSKRPDRPAVAHVTVRAAVTAAARVFPGLPLIAGGKSFGARMTSQAQAEQPLPGVVGLVFFGFPLHPAGKPSDERARHLADVRIPMLFLQGDRDALADTGLLLPVIERLGQRATLHMLAGADHSFRVQRASGRTDAGVLTEALDAMADWLQHLAVFSTDAR
jgi:uncharacterized protein